MTAGKKKSTYSTQDVCTKFDITKTTLFKWEKDGKISKTKKDWRGWRVFSENNVEDIKRIIQEKMNQNK